MTEHRPISHPHGTRARVLAAAFCVAALCWAPPARSTAAESPADIAAPPETIDAPPLGVPIVFVSRRRLPTLDQIYVGPALDVIGRERTPGGRLLVQWPDGRVTDLTARTPLYDVQMPDVSFDGTRVVFSGVEGDGEQWHLYEIGLDGTGLRQLTFDDRSFAIPEDPNYAGRNQWVFRRYGDFGPAYLPDGRIVFASTRYMTLSASCGHRGLNLYVLDPATGEMGRRTTERSGAIDPAVLSSGRIVFSHWFDVMSTPAPAGPGLRPLEYDYNFAPSFWALWSIRPDGSDNGRYAFALGGLSDSGGLHQPRELPDGDIVATFRGSRSLLGSTLYSAVTRIRPGPTPRRTLDLLGDPYKLEAPHAMGPAPLPDGRIVVSYAPTATLGVDWRGLRSADWDFGLYVVDGDLGGLAPLYNLPDTDELDAVAAHPRQAAVIPDAPDSDVISDDPTVDLGLTAQLINRNVYADMPLDGMNPPSPKAGTVTQVEVYDDSQTFTSSEDFPKISKQMPRLIGTFPVDAHGAFTATVPADRSLFYMLVNGNGVAARTMLSPDREDRPSPSVPYFFAHDFLRPGGDFVCTGCHRGHMFQPGIAMSAQANLARLATATASSEVEEFAYGAWRATDQRLADASGKLAWMTDEGDGASLQLVWPMAIEASQVVLYGLAGNTTHLVSGALLLSDGSVHGVGAMPDANRPQVIDLGGMRTITWLRFVVGHQVGQYVGLAEIAVNGPANVALPDDPPPTPTNLTITEGVLSLTWDPVRDPGLAGYKLYYGTEPGVYTEEADVGDVVTFVMRDLAADGTTYYVAAKAYNVHGTESAKLSNEVSATAHGPVVTGIRPDHGRIGGYTPVTITGRHFASSGVRVTMGGRHALSVRVVDDETITALTHWHVPGTVDVEVTNPDDLTSVLPDAFTYVDPERPVLYLPALHRPTAGSAR